MSIKFFAAARKTKLRVGYRTPTLLRLSFLALLLSLTACTSIQGGVGNGPRAVATTPSTTIGALGAPKTAPPPAVTQPAPSRSTPTLEESTRQILNLLNSDDLCDLPCFWGVAPGESWLAARERLKEFVVYISDTAQSNGDILHEIPSNVALGKHGTTFNISIRERAGVVESVTGQISSARFIDTLRPLAPQQVALTYGVPMGVRFFISTDNTVDAGYYHLWNLHSDKGFYIHYAGYARKIGATYEICPSVQHFELSPAAASRGYTAQYGEVAFGSVLINSEGALEATAKEADETFTQSRALSDVTSLNDVAFVELIEQGGAKGCFTTPSSVWEH